MRFIIIISGIKPESPTGHWLYWNRTLVFWHYWWVIFSQKLWVVGKADFLITTLQVRKERPEVPCLGAGGVQEQRWK